MPKTMRRKNSNRKKMRSRTRKAHHGYFPTGATVAYQQDPYSAKSLVRLNANIAWDRNIPVRYNL